MSDKNCIFEETLNEAKDTSEYIESMCFENERVLGFDSSKIEFKDIKFTSCKFENCNFL